VAPSPAQRQRDRHRRSPSSGTSDALLVVEAHRGHVRHHRRQERTDIDAGFHGRRDAEKVQIFGEPVLVPNVDVLEQPLPVLGDDLVGLSRHLGAV
jgi:hypothetical protein